MASGVIKALPDVIMGVLTSAEIPANADNVWIDAPAIDGYSFLCWVTFPSIGWIGYIYTPSPDATHARVFTNAGTSSNARSFRGYAIYKRTL